MTKINTPLKFTPEIVERLENCLESLVSAFAAGKRFRAATDEFARLKDLGYTVAAAYSGSRIAGDLADNQARALRNTIAEAKRQIQLDNDINVSMALISTPDHVFALGDVVRIIEVDTGLGYGGNLKPDDVVLISSVADKGKTLRCNNELGNCWLGPRNVELIKSFSMDDFNVENCSTFKINRS